MAAEHSPDLSIIVLSWNVARLLEACLRTLPAAAGEWWSRAEVIVVDNASTDDSVEMVRRDFPGVRLICLPENLGFSGGNNAGIAASMGKFVFLLNPDTLPDPISIGLLASYLEAHPDVGIVGPRLLNPDGTLQPSRRRFPTLATAFIESTPLQRLMPDVPLLRRFYMLDRPDDEVHEVGWLSGAALMCRRDALDQVGVLDPGYFMFSEEVDLCRRINNAGWRVVYLPTSAITHYGGQSTAQDVPARHIRFNSSKARYFRLHEGRLAGNVVHSYLLLVSLLQLVTEAAKWVLGHKRAMRRARMAMYSQALRSGLLVSRRNRFRSDRVLLVTGEYPPAHGGVGDYTCKLSLALRKAGATTRVLTREQRVPVEGVQSSEVKVQREKGTEVGDQGSGTGNYAIRNTHYSRPFVTRRIALSSLLRAARGELVGVVHIQYQTGAYEMRPTVNFLPMLLRRKWRGATVATFHDLLAPYLFPKAGPVREWANRVLAQSADAVVATNPEDAERLRGWGVQRVELIPIGSNIPANPPAGYDPDSEREKWGIGRDTSLLAYFGFLNSSKGLGDLLAALSRLKEKGDYRLLMVGGGLGSSDPTNRATAEEVARRAQELGVSDRLIWTGYLDPQGVSAALLSADMAALPFSDGASFRRGSLLAVLEHGLSVVTTSVPISKLKVQGSEWPELIDGKNALLVEPGDVAALAHAIETLAGDPALRDQLSAGAKELAHFFSWERIAQLHVALYRDL